MVVVGEEELGWGRRERWVTFLTWVTTRVVVTCVVVTYSVLLPPKPKESFPNKGSCQTVFSSLRLFAEVPIGSALARGEGGLELGELFTKPRPPLLKRCQTQTPHKDAGPRG